MAAPSIGARAESASAAFELVAIARGGKLELYLDDFATNAPIDGAAIEVETPSGPRAAAAQPGRAYVLDAPFLAKPGRYDLVVTVTTAGHGRYPAAQHRDSAGARRAGHMRTVGPLQRRPQGMVTPGNSRRVRDRRGARHHHNGFGAPARRTAWPCRRSCWCCTGGGAGAAARMKAISTRRRRPRRPARPASWRSVMPDGTIFVPKPMQRILAIAHAADRTRHLSPHGRTARPHHPRSECQRLRAAVRRRPAVAAAGRLPAARHAVKEGDVLAYVTPPMQAIDVSDMRQRQGELDQQISIVERKLARYEQLVASGAVARTQLEDTRLELQGLQRPPRRARQDRAASRRH